MTEDPLTPREREVLELMNRGLSLRTIATHLRLSTSRIRDIQFRIKQKTGKENQ